MRRSIRARLPSTSPRSSAISRTDFRAGGQGYGAFKQRLFDALWEYFRPFREKREQLAADPAYVDGVLRAGAAKARAVAAKTMDRVRLATGLR